MPALQAVATETIEVEAKTKEPQVNGAATNGNGTNGVSAHSNGNGNGAVSASTNGVVKVPAAPAVMPSKAAVEVATGVAAATLVSAAAQAAKANGVPTPATPAAFSSNGNGAPSQSSFKALSTASLDEAMDAQAGGQIETVAAQAGAQQQAKRLNKSAEGTPYANPGGRWGKFKSYSTFQVCN